MAQVFPFRSLAVFIPILYALGLFIATSDSRAEEITVNPDLIPNLFAGYSEKLASNRPPLPNDPKGAEAFRVKILARHAQALGVDLVHSPKKIEFETLDTLHREGYTLKKILFESRPNLPIPAHLYLPEATKTLSPAVLCVHGHWPGAKNAPQVHSRCVFLAKRGFVVLALDAIGAGERAYRGITYHGRQLGYQSLPTGKTLAGLHIEDNRRAIDLLCSLPEVDAEAIGVTGASGGGNQTFNLTLMDSRIKAAVGVCFFGTYCGYLHGAHCACELIPGGLTYADEGTLAGMIAPRALALFSAKEDTGAAFRIDDARAQADIARKLYSLADAEDKFEFVEFEGGHDYSQVMRETMVAFFEKHLMGKTNPGRILEPELDLIEPDGLRVLGEAGIPEGTLYVPQRVAQLVEERVVAFESAGKDWANTNARPTLREEMIEKIFGGFPTDIAQGEGLPVFLETVQSKTFLHSEPGVRIPLTMPLTDQPKLDRIVLVLGDYPEGFAPFPDSGCEFAALTPRGTGSTLWPQSNTVDCEDYLLAQGSNILGRPMLGQWTWDALAAVAVLRKKSPDSRIALFGEGVMGLVALFAGVVDEDIAGVATCDSLASYLWPDRFDDRWGLVHFIPGILAVGDLPHLARGLYPRPLILGSPRNGGGERVQEDNAQRLRQSVEGPDAWASLRIEPNLSPAQTLQETTRLFNLPEGKGRP